MKRTTVVNMAHECWDVNIGRGSPWGNPFKVGRDGSREQVITKFRQYITDSPILVEKARRKLKGRVLGCYCKPLECHGDIWVEILDAEPQ